MTNCTAVYGTVNSCPGKVPLHNPCVVLANKSEGYIGYSTTHTELCWCTRIPSSCTIVFNACLRPVYFEVRLVGSMPAALLAMGSSWTWNLILITSKGPTTNLAAQPAMAPAVASTKGLLFAFFAADIGMYHVWHNNIGTHVACCFCRASCALSLLTGTPVRRYTQ